MRWITEHPERAVFIVFALVIAYKLYAIQSGFNAMDAYMKSVGGGTVSTTGASDDDT